MIEGKADRPVWLFINDDRVEALDARGFWGQGIRRTTVVMTGYSHSAGAVGSVLRGKNLKAIGVRGTGRLRIADSTEEWERLVKLHLSLLGANNSSHFMTPADAALPLRRSGGPRRLIAETVRENSALYPRPLPLGAFERPPFCITWQEILACLQAMTADDADHDIARTCTSAGNAYLYSATHLHADYAAGLAEWIDVGQYDNP